MTTKNTTLTLVSHALTRAQRLGHLASPCDELAEPRDTSLPPLQLKATCQLLLGPELRVRQTAALWPQLAQCPTTTDHALRDCELGDWRGRALRDLQQEQPEALQQWLTDPNAAPHGGESMAELYHRMSGWLAALPVGEHYLAISHPLVLRAIAAHVLQIPWLYLDRLDIAPLARLELSCYGRWKMRLG
ncbi:histidine phosphatase family protein [Frateuria aurantia]